MKSQGPYNYYDDNLDDKESDWYEAPDSDYEDGYESHDEHESGSRFVNGVEYSNEELREMEYTRRAEEYMNDPAYLPKQIQDIVDSNERKRIAAQSRQSLSADASITLLTVLFIVCGVILLILLIRN